MSRNDENQKAPFFVRLLKQPFPATRRWSCSDQLDSTSNIQAYFSRIAGSTKVMRFAKKGVSLVTIFLAFLRNAEE
ncbi:hypothetical protein Poly41_34390 [Novipirellula artificiosorum]|uniref:Uncharacterized protein n=1 Tax=Novipirellula artificiosorum TaxID=2528016 RepID=A0A5C6DKC8_9BACT|nr:hypothetical protein Poly41_34390 [Novipirellula artificiosorum]